MTVREIFVVSAARTAIGTYGGSLRDVAMSHLATVAVSVTSSPDFSILGSSPAQANVGQSPTSTITITALNGFTGIVSLTDTIPTGLSCNTISPNTITSSGTATVSCTATVAGNYTLTVTGTSGSLSHSTTALFRFQDFTTSATSPVPVDATQPAASTITIAALNHFSGIVNLSDAIPSGLTCGPITPTTLTGSGTATVSCSANIAGNYTLTITGSSGSLSHSATAVLRFQDFTVAASPSGVLVFSGRPITNFNRHGSSGKRFRGNSNFHKYTVSGSNLRIIQPDECYWFGLRDNLVHCRGRRQLHCDNYRNEHTTITQRNSHLPVPRLHNSRRFPCSRQCG